MMALMTVMFIMGLMTMMSGYVCIYSDVCGVFEGPGYCDVQGVQIGLND
jgi:hypothetical protein